MEQSSQSQAALALVERRGRNLRQLDLRPQRGLIRFDEVAECLLNTGVFGDRGRVGRHGMVIRRKGRSEESDIKLRMRYRRCAFALRGSARVSSGEL